jgi:hypothetical protein
MDDFQEGNFKTLKGALYHLLAIVPVQLTTDYAPFRLELIHEFIGGDEVKTGVAHVRLKFFPRFRRIHLTWAIMNMCKIRDFKSKRNSVGFSDLMNDQVYIKYYAVHDGPHMLPEGDPRDNDRARLSRDWAKWEFTLPKLLASQPLHMVRSYFGEKVAFYFAWMGFYAMWCWIAAIFGVATFIYGIFYMLQQPGTLNVRWLFIFDNPMTWPYAAFISFW